MRNIRFRAWDKACKKMRGLKGVSDLFGIRSDGDCNSDFILMQYTGFKDSEEKEIFDGDIISDWTETDEGIVQSFCQVFWDESLGSWQMDFSFNQDKSSSIGLWQELNDYKYLIVGNIHENKNLIDPNNKV